MTELFRRLGKSLGLTVIAIAMIWVVILVILPQLMMVDLSFRPNLPPSLRGSAEDVYTARNYLTLWANANHRSIFIQTVWSSLLVTLLSLAVCYPIAYYLAQVAKGRLAVFLAVALIIPFWVNEILRTFSWFLILSRNGLINYILQALDLTQEPISFGGTGAVLIGMVYAYILFMVLPLYNALESLDPNQIEAARDLGASWLRIHWRVIIPHAKPGIAIGCVMVFMLSAGTVAVPQIMQSLPGGTNARWFTQVIYSWFFDGGDWNHGAAYAFALLLLCIVFIVLMLRLFKVSLGEIAK